MFGPLERAITVPVIEVDRKIPTALHHRQNPLACKSTSQPSIKTQVCIGLLHVTSLQYFTSLRQGVRMMKCTNILWETLQVYFYLYVSFTFSSLRFVSTR
jgi:hypothetical protein